MADRAGFALKLNASGPYALVNCKGPSSQPILTEVHRAALARVIEDRPMHTIHGVRWRVINLMQWLSDGMVRRRTQDRPKGQDGLLCDKTRQSRIPPLAASSREQRFLSLPQEW